MISEESRDRIRRDANKRIIAKREERKQNALDASARAERAEHEGQRLQDSFESDFLNLIKQTSGMDNDEVDRRLNKLQKQHGKKSWIGRTPIKLSKKQQRQMAKAKKLAKRKKGWFW